MGKANGNHDRERVSTAKHFDSILSNITQTHEHIFLVLIFIKN
jgi:hypothetical protein